MTSDERQGFEPTLPTLVPNLDAQRAYAASIAPPPRPRLPQEMLRRARLAGGVGGAAMLLGTDVAALGVLLLLLPLLVGSLVRWLESMLVDVDAAAASAMIEALHAGPWVWIGSSLLAVGLAALAIGALVSVRTLRAAGFERPLRLTGSAFGVALAGRVVLNVFTAPFSSLLAPLLDRGLAGLAVGGIELVGTIVALVIAAAMNVAIASATGMVAWWLIAHATRPAAEIEEPEPPAWTSLLERHHMPH